MCFQVYHVCYGKGHNYSFLCENGTVFNQFYYVCDWWYNVDCLQSPEHYHLNKFNKLPLPVKPTVAIRKATQRLKDFTNRQNFGLLVGGEFGRKSDVVDADVKKQQDDDDDKAKKKELDNYSNLQATVNNLTGFGVELDYYDDYYYDQYAEYQFYKVGNKVKRNYNGKEECYCRCSCDK